MKKLALFLLCFLMAFPCFAIDTEIGKVNLSSNQRKNFGTMVKPEPFKGFSIWQDGTVVGVSEVVPTEEEKQFALNLIQTLPEEVSQEAAALEFSYKELMGRLYDTMEPASVVKLGQYTGVIEQMCEWKSFTAIKQFLEELAQQQILTQDELLQLNNAFLAQGIDFSKW